MGNYRSLFLISKLLGFNFYNITMYPRNTLLFMFSVKRNVIEELISCKIKRLYSAYQYNFYFISYLKIALNMIVIL